MFDDLLKELSALDQRRLDEVFDMNEASDLATPDPRPLRSEKTIFDWLDRIEQWGKVTYYYKSPDKWGKQKITRKRFIDLLTDEELIKMFGRWQIKKKGFTKVIIRREYLDIGGKKKKEKFIVDIKVKK